MKISIVLSAPQTPPVVLPGQLLCDWLPYRVNPLYRLGTAGPTTSHAASALYLQDLTHWLDCTIDTVRAGDDTFLDCILNFVGYAEACVAAKGVIYIDA